MNVCNQIYKWLQQVGPWYKKSQKKFKYDIGIQIYLHIFTMSNTDKISWIYFINKLSMLKNQQLSLILINNLAGIFETYATMNHSLIHIY